MWILERVVRDIVSSPFSIFFLLIRLPPTSTLFPYTTLFRSRVSQQQRRTAVLQAYSLRKSQRVLAAIDMSVGPVLVHGAVDALDRKSTRLNSSHRSMSYAVFCLKKKNNIKINLTP